jgi:hypothetical protein
MRRASVGVRVDGNRSNPHPPRSADDAAGNLTAVGDQHLPEHAPLWQSAHKAAIGIPPLVLTKQQPLDHFA